MRLYLASTSPARLATLRAAGIEPVVVPSEVDEEAAVVTACPQTTAQMVQLLARLKAEAVAARADADQFDGLDGFILGADSAFELDGVGYGKPHTPSVARERWLLQRGRTGQLHTGHWLIDHRAGAGRAGAGGAGVGRAGAGAAGSAGGTGTGGTGTGGAGAAGAAGAAGITAAGSVSTASVTFASDITDEEIDRYIATGEPLEVAGAFTIDSLGAPFISSITGDPHAVVGLSLAALRELFLGFGVSWPALWNR